MTTPLVKPRKTPAQARSAETVRVILEAAARILETRGLDGYTTNAVAELAGVSVGSLYQYFPGKDALTASLLDCETGIFLASMEYPDPVADSRAALDHLIGACVKHQLRRPELARILDFEEQRLPLRDQQEGLAARLTGTITEILTRLPVDRGEAPRVMAGDIFAMTRGIVDAAGERGETDEVRLRLRVARAVYGYLGLAQAR